MNAFIIKSGICMVLFFGLYWLILRKEKLFIYNRYYLIFSILFSLAVPLISFPVTIVYEKAPVFTSFLPANMPEVDALPNQEKQTPLETASAGNPYPDRINRSQALKPVTPGRKNILLDIYLMGTLLMLVRFSRNILKVRQMLGRSEQIYHEGYKIALLNDRISPFSFFHTIFLNKQDYVEKRVGDYVINHELEHIRQAHSFDIIFFEILHLLFWFNPVLILYKRAARINHEYLADEAVIRGTSDLKTYTSELVTFISHRLTIPYTSGFSPSMIRLRLLMLNTKASRKAQINRVLLTLFMSVILIAGLSMKPEYKTDDNKRRRIAAANKDIIIQDVFFRDKGFDPLQTLVVIDGKRLGPDDSVNLVLTNIKTLNLWSDRKARRKYGRSARNGVLEISTYDADRSSVPDSSYFKPIYTVNGTVPGNFISIPVSSLYSVSMWTYPVFPNQDLLKRWRLLEIMTRDYYKISGSVIKSNCEPIAGVKVSSTDNPSEVITNDEGRFLLSDINPGSTIQLSSEGYAPFSFEVRNVFKTDLAITLYGINEPDSDLMITGAGKEIRDFSGRWKLNKNLSKFSYPADYDRVYDIRQFNSDSIQIKITSTYNEGNVYGHSNTYVFNTAKTELNDGQTSKQISSCTISPDGQSFSLSDGSKSIIRSPRKYAHSENYSLSEDGKQLFIKEDFMSVPAYGSVGVNPPLVFDKE